MIRRVAFSPKLHWERFRILAVSKIGAYRVQRLWFEDYTRTSSARAKLAPYIAEFRRIQETRQPLPNQADFEGLPTVSAFIYQLTDEDANIHNESSDNDGSAAPDEPRTSIDSRWQALLPAIATDYQQWFCDFDTSLLTLLTTDSPAIKAANAAVTAYAEAAGMDSVTPLCQFRCKSCGNRLSSVELRSHQCLNAREITNKPHDPDRGNWRDWYSATTGAMKWDPSLVALEAQRVSSIIKVSAHLT